LAEKLGRRLDAMRGAEERWRGDERRERGEKKGSLGFRV
jgi:hypothetical protein